MNLLSLFVLVQYQQAQDRQMDRRTCRSYLCSAYA